MAKRIFDFLVAALLFVILFPLMAIIAFAIKATSCGPVIFKQKRVGYKEGVFTIFKFRTMEDGSAKTLDVVSKGDGHITKVGRILRPTHLDELPQLWNVLRGDMSLVGPRPDPCDWSYLRIGMNDDHRRRYDVKPGITGLAQIKGREWIISNGNSATDLDVGYSQNRSFIGDLWILLSTISVILKRQGI